MIIEFSITDPLDLIHTAYFKILGRHDTYEVKIKIENGTAGFQASDCTCKWGSFASQTKENQRNGKICRHLSECLLFLEREGWITSSENKSIIKENGQKE